jgi:hypothetical protein
MLPRAAKVDVKGSAQGIVGPALAIILIVVTVPPTDASIPGGGQHDIDAKAQMSLEPRGSILVDGDEGFEDPTVLNGVRSGNGTSEDPYVISNWTIEAADFYGIRLTGTSAHVVIQDVWIANAGQRHAGAFWGIHVRDASNVTIQRVLVSEARGIGVEFERSEDSALRDSRIGHPATEGTSSVTTGISATDSSRIVFENVTVKAAESPGAAWGSTDVEIRQSTFWSDPEGGSNSLYVPYSSSVTIARNEFLATPLDIWDTSGEITIDRNAFSSQAPPGDEGPPPDRSEAGYGLIASLHAGDGLEVCGNTFDGVGMGVSPAGGDRIVGNEFNDSDLMLDVAGSDPVAVERNTFTSNSGVPLQASDAFEDSGLAHVHRNVFEDNEGPVKFYGNASATDNWWGAADGPNVTDGPPNGSGQEVAFLGTPEPQLDPWLEQPPDAGPSAVTCEAPPGPVGAQQGPDLDLHLEAGLSVDPSTDGLILSGAQLRASIGVGPIPVSGE